ncbi:MAG: helix-turn-helix domain-containing protein [Flavobacteriaceae bacterium]
MKNLTQNIRKIRELKGYSQQYVAIALNISQRQYSRLENNEVDIKISILKKLPPF